MHENGSMSPHVTFVKAGPACSTHALFLHRSIVLRWGSVSPGQRLPAVLRETPIPHRLGPFIPSRQTWAWGRTENSPQLLFEEH